MFSSWGEGVIVLTPLEDPPGDFRFLEEGGETLEGGALGSGGYKGTKGVAVGGRVAGGCGRERVSKISCTFMLGGKESTCCTGGERVTPLSIDMETWFIFWRWNCGNMGGANEGLGKGSWGNRRFEDGENCVRYPMGKREKGVEKLGVS